MIKHQFSKGAGADDAVSFYFGPNNNFKQSDKHRRVISDSAKDCVLSMNLGVYDSVRVYAAGSGFINLVEVTGSPFSGPTELVLVASVFWVRVVPVTITQDVTIKLMDRNQGTLDRVNPKVPGYNEGTPSDPPAIEQVEDETPDNGLLLGTSALLLGNGYLIGA